MSTAHVTEIFRRQTVKAHALGAITPSKCNRLKIWACLVDRHCQTNHRGSNFYCEMDGILAQNHNVRLIIHQGLEEQQLSVVQSTAI